MLNNHRLISSRCYSIFLLFSSLSLSSLSDRVVLYSAVYRLSLLDSCSADRREVVELSADIALYSVSRAVSSLRECICQPTVRARLHSWSSLVV